MVFKFGHGIFCKALYLGSVGSGTFLQGLSTRWQAERGGLQTAEVGSSLKLKFLVTSCLQLGNVYVGWKV